MMIPKPTRLTKIVRKMMASGRVTLSQHSIQSPRMRLPIVHRGARGVVSGSRITTLVGIAALTAAAGAAGIGAQQRAPAPPPAPFVTTHADTLRPEILGTHGIVAAGRHYSVSAGVRILQQGGNAVDAGVATVLAASVCEISHFGFGGESPAMIYDAKTRDIIVINGQGPAPGAATPALIAEQGLIPGNGRPGPRFPSMLDPLGLGFEARARCGSNRCCSR